ncbi:MAG: alpha/beta hydrolase-fold protein [Gammaproteobacteria bacterium]|nr:alpha/beta hydrolase-fold protein [Gammaproteobacteria bacterium]
MPKQNFDQPHGKIEILEIDSTALKNNMLGDPAVRSVAMYLPQGYDSSAEDYPLLVDIVGFTGSGFAHIGWKAFSESVPQRIDRLIDEGKMGPVIVALPDCFTSLGGNQYINSAAMGNWADFLTQEMIRAIENKYRVKRGRQHRGIFGKSSGGYGAIIHGMLYADTWGATACHSGDMAFDLCYRGDMAGTLMQLSGYEGGVAAFMEKIQSDRKVSGSDMHLLMNLAMAASYDPDPEQPYGVRLPVNEKTCELIEERWANWLAWDPVRMIERVDVQDNLKSLQGLYIDCGASDQYNLVFGARQLTGRLKALDIVHQYEEFADNHSNVDYRMDVSLPYLYEAIK